MHPLFALFRHAGPRFPGRTRIAANLDNGRNPFAANLWTQVPEWPEITREQSFRGRRNQPNLRTAAWAAGRGYL